MNNKLDELRDIIINYDELISVWFDGEDVNDYAEESDNLRNKAFKLIEELKKQ